jgi:hypothetical protein
VIGLARDQTEKLELMEYRFICDSASQLLTMLDDKMCNCLRLNNCRSCDRYGCFGASGSYPMGHGKFIPGAGMGAMLAAGASKGWTHVSPNFGSFFGESAKLSNNRCE